MFRKPCVQQPSDVGVMSYLDIILTPDDEGGDILRNA